MSIKTDIAHAGRLISEGGVVAFPTETVYGLGADAFNPKAVARVFEIKERPSFDPLIVHISNLAQLDELWLQKDERLLQLAEKFWPGPLTIVVEKHPSVPDIVTSGLPTVGIRMPGHPVALALIEAAGTPVAAPSANKFGRISPTNAEHVRSQLPEADFILNGGATTIGIESTVISLGKNGFTLLRPGAFTVAEIAEVLPRVFETDKGSEKHSPGHMLSHYSPRKPIYFTTDAPAGTDISLAGLISFGAPLDASKYKLVEVLSAKKDMKEAAVNLFGAMHRMEAAGVAVMLVEPLPEEGIGIAIMDRLRKATFQYKPQ